MAPGPEPAPSTWRGDNVIKSRFSELPGIHTVGLEADSHPLSSATSVSFHNRANVLAVGSPAGKGEPVQLYQIDRSYDRPVTLKSAGCVFGTAHVQSLSWFNDQLLTADSLGEVHAYPLHARDSEPASRRSATYSHRATGPRTYRPGRWPHSDCVRAVQHCPSDPTLFISLFNNHIYLWNGENEDSPVHNLKIDKAPLHSICWCPQSPNMYAVAGSQRSISVMDSREYSTLKKVQPAWLQPFAHAATITEVAWSPLVPHWLASASQDGHAKIWDLRYGAQPVAVLDQHVTKVTAVSWCPTHADLIMTGGQDCSAKLWQLTNEPRYCVASVDASLDDTVCGVAWSPTTPWQAVAVAQNGDTMGISFGEEFTSTIAPSRYEPDSLERESEVLFYARELEDALNQITTMAARHQKGKRYGKALALAEMSVPRHCPTDFTFGTQEFRPHIFQQEVAEYGYHLPPNLPQCLADMIPDDLFNRTALRLVNLRILAWTPNANGGADIEEIERSMFEQLEKDYRAIDAHTVHAFLQGLLPQDPVRALDFGLRYGALLQQNKQFDNFAPIAHLLLYPTIYDVGIGGDNVTLDIPSVLREKTVKALTPHLKNNTVVMSQITLTRDVNRALLGPDAGARVIEIVGDRQLILSSFVCRTYFHTLISHGKYDQFYIPATAIARLIDGFPFAEDLTDLMNGAPFTRLRSLILDAQVKQIEAPWDKKRLRRAVLIAANILQNCTFLPAMLSTSLPRMFGQLVKTLSSALTELQREPTRPGKKTGEQQAQKLAEAILDQFKLMKRDARVSKTGKEPELQECITMLKRFCP